MSPEDAGSTVTMNVLQVEHDRLNILLNQLQGALGAGADQAALAEIFEALVEAARQHFRSEERHFGVHAYPEAEAHESEHRALLKVAFHVRDRFAQRSPNAREEALQLIREWRQHHDGGSDGKFDGFLAARSPP